MTDSVLDSSAAAVPPARLLKIQEVAADLGLTTRAIRYYEEIGLLEPAGRSEGAYRLYDADDVERRAILADAMLRVDGQIARLRAKSERLAAMIADAEARRAHLDEHLAELESGITPAPHAP